MTKEHLFRQPLRLRLNTNTAAKSTMTAQQDTQLYPFTPRAPALDFTRRRRKDAPSRLSLSAAYQARIPRTHRMHVLPAHPLDVGIDGRLPLYYTGAGQLCLAPPRVTLSPVRATYVYREKEIIAEPSSCSDALALPMLPEDTSELPPMRRHVRVPSYDSVATDITSCCATHSSIGTPMTSAAGSPGRESTPLSRSCDSCYDRLDDVVAIPVRCTRFRPRTTFAHLQRTSACRKSDLPSFAPQSYARCDVATSPCPSSTCPRSAIDVTDVSLVRLQRILASPLYIDDCYV